MVTDKDVCKIYFKHYENKLIKLPYHLIYLPTERISSTNVKLNLVISIFFLKSHPVKTLWFCQYLILIDYFFILISIDDINWDNFMLTAFKDINLIKSISLRDHSSILNTDCQIDITRLFYAY